MASTANTSNPGLVAILLVCNTRTGSGAQIVYHHPPQPLSSSEALSNSASECDDIESSSSDSEESSSGEEDGMGRLSTGIRVARTHNSRLATATDDRESSSENQNGRGSSSANSLFGLSTDGLVSLLSPDRAWHKRKFELGINDLTFVGRPVFVRHSGSWRRQKRTKGRSRRAEQPTSDTVSGSDEEQEPSPNPNPDAKSTDPEQVEGASKQPSKSQLTMFHVVFVISSPPLEHSLRVKDMWDHVIKKFSRALKWEQVHNDYVWQQSELVLSRKAASSSKKLSPHQLSRDIMEHSSLATAIAGVYDAISTSRIATVVLSSKRSVTLQISPITSTSHLPSLTDPPIKPGLWLTTATDVWAPTADNDANLSSTAIQTAKHCTLLLKALPQRMAREVHQAGGVLAHHLPRFIAELRPTKSLYKLSVACQISVADVQLLAHHLIYYRRAVAIPPLYQWDTYIVSPNADLAKLRDACRVWERSFPPTMPPLPKMLSFLSGIPRPYGSLIPSNDHKEMYYLALAWLMRHGWVTQLRTFAYVKVSPTVKRQVRDADRDSRIRMSQKQSSTEPKDEATSEAVRPRNKRPSIASHPSSDGRRSIEGSRKGTNQRMGSLILNPPRASAEESRWLEHIGETLLTTTTMTRQGQPVEFTAEERADLEKYWPILVKYFNGSVALETIPVRENLKRKFVWNLLDKMGMNANRSSEDEESRLKSLLLTVHHW